MYDAAASKRYRERHPDRVRAMVKRWRAKSKKHIRDYENARYAGWSEEQRRKRNIKARARRQGENRDEYLAYLRQWRKDNKDQIRVTRATHRKKRLGLPGKYDKSDIERIRKQQNNKCAYCKIALRGKEHLDHIIPVARGGTNHPHNLQLLCAPCNRRKNAKDPIYFAQEMGFLL